MCATRQTLLSAPIFDILPSAPMPNKRGAPGLAAAPHEHYNSAVMYTPLPPVNSTRQPTLPHRRWPFRAGSVRARISPGARLLLALLAGALCVLAACAPHPGGDEIAFIRNGQLWTVNSDGSNALAIARGSVVGFAWSPDHHQLVFRYGNSAVPLPARTSAPDAPGDLGVIGVDGGAPVTITPVVAGIARSDAWWDANGNRLLYREGFPPAPGQEPQAVLYQVSQADQPAGIARKSVLDAVSMPVLSADGSQVAVLDPDGNVRVGPPGAVGRTIATAALLTLPGSDRPARLLWQPHHQMLLFARQATAGAANVALVLADLQGHTRTVGTAHALLDYAFSPDGNLLLVQTPTSFEVWRVNGGTDQPAVFSWPESDAMALAWWSPDSRWILVRDTAGLSLANVRAHTARQLMASAAGAAAAPSTAAWRPLAGSPWSADGQRIVFADPGTGRWAGRSLAAPNGGTGGLYVASITGSATPTLIDSGADEWPSWSYLDPSASFLVAS